MTENVPRWWKSLKDFYLVYLPLRFNLFLVALIAFAFLCTDQGHDIVARLVGHKSTLPAIVFDCFVLLLGLQVWFWSRQLLHVIPKDPPASRFPRWTRWIPRLLGIFVFAIAFLALLRVKGTGSPALKWYVGVLAVYFILFIVFVIVRRTMLKEADDAEKTVPELSTQAKAIFVATAVLYVAFFALSFNIKTMEMVTSPVIILLVAAIWVSVGVAITYLGHRWGMPLFTFLIVFAVAISRWTDNHVVPTLPLPPNYARLDPVTAFNRWIESRPGFTDGYPVFFVATEGGGIRAGYWTAAVLGELHDKTGGRFTEHTFAISSISGGSLGATAYDVAVANRVPNVRETATKALEYDALAPTLGSFLVPDLLQRFIPVPFIRDRARALELGWEAGWRGAGTPAPEAFTTGLLDLFAKNGNAIPSLFLNGAVVETGERAITSNCHIQWPDALDTFDELGGDLAISTATLMTARFPYISPAGTIIKAATANPATLPKCGAGERCAHVVDGGYFESSAAATLIQLLATLRDHPDSKLNYLRVKPYIILIRYDDPSKQATSAQFAMETTAPLRALGSALGARAKFSVNRLGPFGTNIPFQLGPPPPEKPALPLGWLLSDYSMFWMKRSIAEGPNQKCVADISAMLGGATPPPGSCAWPRTPWPTTAPPPGRRN